MGSMRLAKREVTDPEALRQIVDACRTVRIAAVDDEGIFIVPMSFGYEWEDVDGGPVRLTLWLHSAGEGRKAEAFRTFARKGSHVAIEMDLEDGVIRGDYSCAWSFAYRSVMGTGAITEVADEVDKQHGLDQIMAHLAPGERVAYAPEALERVSVWRVDVASFTGKQRRPK